MIDFKKRERNTEERQAARSRRHGKTEAETGVWEHLEPSLPQECDQALPFWTSALWNCEGINVVSSHQVCGHCYSSPGRQIQAPSQHLELEDKFQGRESESEVTQLCPTLCDPTDCSLPGFSIHGVFQARILEWVAISFSRGFSPTRDRTQVSCIAGRCFTL